VSEAGTPRRSDGQPLDVVDLRRRTDAILAEASGPWSTGAADELVALHRTALRQLEVVEWVQLASDRLAEAGPVSELIERAPNEAANALGLDRALLSRVEEGRLHTEALHCGEGAGDPVPLLALLQAEAVELEYPSIEAEMFRRRQGRVVRESEAVAGRMAFGAIMRWREYMAAPIVLGGKVIAFFHGDRPVSREPLGSLECRALERLGDAFAAAFERAVLRRRLRTQRRELRAVASWADARIGQLSDSAIDLGAEGEVVEAAEVPGHSSSSQLQEVLTKRELEVLEHVIKGETNGDIARALVISEETIKFHVKNILRKLGASNRGEAISRYLRLQMNDRRNSGQPTRAL
jgi:DNA-binding CsgD family transcriptional regulator